MCPRFEDGRLTADGLIAAVPGDRLKCRIHVLDGTICLGDIHRVTGLFDDLFKLAEFPFPFFPGRDITDNRMDGWLALILEPAECYFSGKLRSVSTLVGPRKGCLTLVERCLNVFQCHCLRFRAIRLGRRREFPRGILGECLDGIDPEQVQCLFVAIEEPVTVEQHEGVAAILKQAPVFRFVDFECSLPFFPLADIPNEGMYNWPATVLESCELHLCRELGAIGTLMYPLEERLARVKSLVDPLNCSCL